MSIELAVLLPKYTNFLISLSISLKSLIPASLKIVLLPCLLKCSCNKVCIVSAISLPIFVLPILYVFKYLANILPLGAFTSTYGTPSTNLPTIAPS